jgi:hypothetical protein
MRALVLTASLAAFGEAAAAPVNQVFADVPGTLESLWEDSDNRVGAPVITLYFLPRRAAVDPRTFSFEIDPESGASYAAFDLVLGKSRELGEQEAFLKGRAAAQYAVPVDHVMLLPLPFHTSKTTKRLNGSQISDLLLPGDDTPVMAPLHFEVEFTAAGTAKFQETVELELLFATYAGKVWMRESKASDRREEMSFSVGLALGGLAYCQVIPRGCE